MAAAVSQKRDSLTKPALPTKERVIKDVKPINTRRLTDADIYHGNKIDPSKLKKHFLEEGRLTEETASRVVREATNLLKAEKTVLEVQAPLTICGDIHGQYFDLIHLFEVGGDLPDTRYLFLGDYVDRGMFSTECLLYLYALKIRYPKHLHLLRGNHECRHLTQFFTFKEECKVKYSLKLYSEIMNSFDALPLACLMNGKFLCIHGGLSPNIHTLDEIKKIDRFKEPPKSGPMCDLLWADPKADFGEETTDEFFCHNTGRGCSFYFSYAAACSFIEANGLLSIIRAHEAQDLGYRMYRKCPSTNFPAVFTLFSAPNYLDMYNNKGAILRYDNNTINVKTYKATPHPYWLPNFMDAFTWSFPFVGEKVTDMLVNILNICSQEELDIQPSESTITAEKREQLLHKIRAVSKMSRYYQTLNESNDIVIKLKGLTSNGMLPFGALHGGSENLQKAIESDEPLTFLEAKQADAKNEQMPGVVVDKETRATITSRDAYLSNMKSKQQKSRGSISKTKSAKSGNQN